MELDTMQDVESIARRDPPSGLTHQEELALKVSTLCVSAISVFSALLAFYWFVRMRRSFRHDLIMVLIQADAFKALWFMIFPIVDLAVGPILPESRFCQVSGFFLTVGIEASDLAVLMIALHTALYIFRRKGSSSGRGLYPYRFYAYAVIFLVPFLMGGLAFLNQPYGFVNLAAFCYFPTRPQWPRLALSWAPRYFIFATILSIYGFIYLYVTMLMRRYGHTGTLQHQSAAAAEPSPRIVRRLSSLHPLPPIIPPSFASTSSASVSRRGSEVDPRAEDRERQASMSTSGTMKVEEAGQRHVPRRALTPIESESQASITWTWPNFNGSEIDSWGAGAVAGRKSMAIGRDMVAPSEQAVQTPGTPSGMAPTPLNALDHIFTIPAAMEESRIQPGAFTGNALRPGSPAVTVDADGAKHGQLRPVGSFWQRHFSTSSATTDRKTSSTESSMPGFISLLRGRGPRASVSSTSGFAGERSTTAATSTQGGHGVEETANGFPAPNYSTAASEVNSMTRARDKIRRQLRLLFVYPLVYMLMWVFPFVSQIMRWEFRDHSGPPFPFVLLALVSLSSQGWVNALVFSLREKPWRHATRRNSSDATGCIWENIKVGKYSWGWWGHNRNQLRSKTTTGRSKDEMRLDGEIARQRREAEIEEQRRMKMQSAMLMQMTAGSPPRPPGDRGAPKDWWDGLDEGLDIAPSRARGNVV